MPLLQTDTPLRWAIFCRVVDNLGDVGVCWRLAAELGARGHEVRLVIDDASALAWMAPEGARGVAVEDWLALEGGATGPLNVDVLIEAFGCELPAAVVRALFDAAPAPVWINLEYLTAERYAEDAHGLPSPQFDATGRRLDKWFFFPGFSMRSGGLLREQSVVRRPAFSRDAWLASQGITVGNRERVVSLFCYDNPALDALLITLASASSPEAHQQTLLLATAGTASTQVERLLGPTMRRGGLRAMSLPWLSQVDYDHLLWSCDLNIVRGEDSFVRAQWAGAPFFWHAYPQTDGAHADKVDAFLARLSAEADVRAWFHVWNGMCSGDVSLPPWPDMKAWQRASSAWRDTLSAQPDLVTRLIGFVAGKR